MTLFDAEGWQTDASTECLNNSLFGQLTAASTKHGRSGGEASSGSQQHEKKSVKQSGQKRPKCDTSEEKQTVISKKSKSHDSSDPRRVLTCDSSQSQSESTIDTKQMTTERSQEQVERTRKCEPKRKPNKRNKYKHLIQSSSKQSINKEVNSEDVHSESKKNNKQQTKRKRTQPSTGDGLVQDVATRTQHTEATPTSEPPMKKKRKKRKVKKGASDTTTDGVREAAMDNTSSVHKKHMAADVARDAETESVTTAPVTSTGMRKNHKHECKTGDGKNSKKVTTSTKTTRTVDSSSASMSPAGKKTVTPVSAVKAVRANIRQSPFNVARLKAVFRHEMTGPADTSQVSPGGGVKDTASKTQENTTERKSDRKGATEQSSPQTLRERMQEKLNSARFRYINEQLYRSTGEEAHRLFTEDPETFEVYHEGYQAQVAKWPVNPVNKVIEYISARPTSQVVADLGCGDAKVSRAVKNLVLSFDLVAVNDSVTACDISKLPLEDSSVDIAVFCLSLMGTDFVQFLCEANRILRLGGRLLVAEVVSRFDKIGAFVRKLTKLGFSLQDKDTSNTMFVWFEFMKIGKPDMEKLPKIVLTPCVYKKR